MQEWHKSFFLRKTTALKSIYDPSFMFSGQNNLQIFTIDPNCHWPLIAEINLHTSSKSPTGDSKPTASNCLFETIHQRFSNHGTRSTDNTWAAAPAHIGIERELRDNQNFSTDIEKRTVHLAFIVSKDAQMDNFIRQGLYLSLTIVLPHSKQYQKS